MRRFCIWGPKKVVRLFGVVISCPEGEHPAVNRRDKTSMTGVKKVHELWDFFMLY